MVLLVSPLELKRAPDDLIAPEMSFGAVHVPLMFGHEKAFDPTETSRESPLFKREGCPLRCDQSAVAVSRSGQGKPSSIPTLWAQSAM